MGPLTLALLCLTATPKPAAAPATPPIIAVLPPVPLDGAESWIGLAVADNLTGQLLRHTRTDPKSKKSERPLTVFSFRETLSAARAEGLDARRELTAADLDKLARQLGARYVFTGSYRTTAGKSPQVILQWRLFDLERPKGGKQARVKTNLFTLSTQTGRLAASLLQAMGEKPTAAARRGDSPVPLKALRAYAKGLEILAAQSLEPHARVVLPAIELKKAQILFETATLEAPELLAAWVGQGLASAMLGQLERAEKEILRALVDAAQAEPAHELGLYYLYVRQGRPADAIAALTKAVARHPGFVSAQGYLGSAQLRAGKPQKALEVFAAYERRVPESPWVRVMHARALAYAGQHDAAIDKTRAVLAQFPASVMVISSLAARQAQAGKHAEALDTLERGLSMHAEHPELLTRLAYVHLQLDHPSEALALSRRAIEKLGDGRGEASAGYAYANQGHALALLGKREEALAAFAKAAELGIGVEERLLLLADPRTKKLMQDPANPLAKDTPPPPPPLPPPPLGAATEPADAAPAQPTAATEPAAPTAAAPAQPAAATEPAAVAEPSSEAAAPAEAAAEPAAQPEEEDDDDVWATEEEWAEEETPPEAEPAGDAEAPAAP